MKREQVSWLQKLQRRLTRSSLVTAWMGVNSNRDDLYFPFLSRVRREGQDVSESAGRGESEQSQNVQDESDRD